MFRTTDRQTGRQADRQLNKQIDRKQAVRQTVRQTDRMEKGIISVYIRWKFGFRPVKVMDSQLKQIDTRPGH